MRNKKVTAGVLTASMLAPIAAQFAPVVVMAADARENTEHILYDGNKDCRTGDEVEQGLSLMCQDQTEGYQNVGVIVYKLPDDAEIGGANNKGGATVDGERADKYDLSKAEKVTSFHTITFDDQIWTDGSGNVLEYDRDGVGPTGKPTFVSLSAGKYLLVYDDSGAGFGSGDKFTRVPFIVGDEESSDTMGAMVKGKMASLDLECVAGIKKPETPQAETGSVEVQAIVVETDEQGNPIKNGDSFVPTGDKVEGVKVIPDGDYFTQADIDSNFMKNIMGEEYVVKSLESAGKKDGRKLQNLVTNSEGKASAEDVRVNNYPFTVEIPEGYTMADAENDTNFSMDVKKDSTAVHVIELYKTPETPKEIPQILKVIVRDKETKAEIEGAGFSVTAKDNTEFEFTGTSITGGVDKNDVLVDTYTASLTSVPEGYKLNTETVSVTLQEATAEGQVTTLILEVEKGEAVGSLVTIVRDKDTKKPIPDATVQILDKDGKVILETKTDENGSVNKDELPEGDYTIKVVEVPDGYAIPEDQTATVVVNKTTTNIFELEKATGDLSVIVRDKNTKDPIPGATVVIKDKDGKVIDTVVTDENGKISKEKLPVGDYTIEVTEVPDGYTPPAPQTVTVVKDENKEVIFELEKGVNNLEVIVRDKDTKKAIPNAKVEIVDKDGKVIDTVVTDENGMISKKDLPEGDYTIKVVEVPDGYTVPEDQIATIENGKTTQKIFELEKAKGNLEVVVRDKDTKKPIPNAKVEIVDKDDKVIDTITTDENGTISKENLPIGDYTIKVVEVPDGYTIPENQKATIEKDNTTHKIFELEKNIGNLEVIVRDKDTKEPIPNAKVEIVDKDGKVIDTVITDKDGKISKNNLPIGDYTIKVVEVPDGYTIPEDQKATIEKDKTTQKIFEVEKGVGNLEVVVRDKDTKEPISNAKVQIIDKDGKVIATVTTDKDGKIVKKDLPLGNYTIKVTEVPEGYKAPADQTAKIEKGKTTQKIFEVEKGIGALHVLVRDKDTKVAIPDARVQIVDKDGKVILDTKTNRDGTVDKNNLPAGDYTIKVLEVPNGYNRPADTIAPVKVNKRTNVIFELEKGLGNLEVTIRDKDTKEPIPGAVVQIADNNGTLITTLTTDKNGKISKKDLPPAEYIIRTQSVPEGYRIPGNEKATVKKGETARVIIELEKGVGALEVIVRDKNTKEPIPNAQVEVVDENGKRILTTITDINGRIEKDKLPMGKYTIKVLQVPQGYNKPNDQSVTIKKSVKTTVIFELEKPKATTTVTQQPTTPTTPQTPAPSQPNNNIVRTGDNNNIFALVGAGVVSIAGMLFVSKKKNKKDE